MKKMLERVGLVLLGVALVGLLAWWAPSTIPKSLGSSPQGTQTLYATSSVLTLVQAVPLTMFASSSCTARLVTTIAQPITIRMSDNNQFSWGSNLGIFQAASTTVLYDAQSYGCGLWTGFGANTAATSGVNVIVEEFTGSR